MRNLEAKFRLPDHRIARARAESIGFVFRAAFEQRDVFFVARAGKLKLREEEGRACLIHYRRSPHDGLDLSDYEIVEVTDGAKAYAMLATAMGVVGEVRKRRTLLARRNVRLHLDRVEGLGDFGEIEAVLGEGDSAADFHADVREILAALDVGPGDLIDRSYFEMIVRERS